MKLVIETDEARYKDIQRIAEVQRDLNHFQTAEQIIADGTPYEERKTGRWVTDGCLDKCSCCGVSRDDQLYDNYCGNCGAKMEGAAEK